MICRIPAGRLYFKREYLFEIGQMPEHFIERFFLTLKAALLGFPIHRSHHQIIVSDDFRRESAEVVSEL